MIVSSIWSAPQNDVVTSATLDEVDGSPDRLTLYARGEPVTSFELPAGDGARALTELGFKKAPQP